MKWLLYFGLVYSNRILFNVHVVPNLGLVPQEFARYQAVLVASGSDCLKMNVMNPVWRRGIGQIDSPHLEMNVVIFLISGQIPQSLVLT